MRKRRTAIVLAGLLLFALGPGISSGQTPAPDTQQITSQTAPSTITLQAGTHVNLAMTSPVWAKSAQVGDPIYAECVFPVAHEEMMAIPPGTYLEGRINALERPTRRSNRAEFQIQFTKLIFANGYTVELGSSAVAQNDVPAGTPVASADVLLSVSYASDILLDNGTQFEMVLQAPLTLDSQYVASAVKNSKPLTIAKVQSAAKCRPVPATPGTEPTIIPGTPATPGTPDTVIPGAPGMPDTVIPGTPGTPGTPDTVIGGTSGSPGIACPGPPVVISSLSAPWDHAGNFQLPYEVTVAGQKLAAGKYKAVWQGLGPKVEASILQNDHEVARLPAQAMTMKERPKKDSVTTNENPDGSTSLELLQFSGSDLALRFDGSGAQANPPGKAKAPTIQ